MASNQSMLEQMLQAALSGGGLREKEGDTAAGPAQVAPATSAIYWEACSAARPLPAAALPARRRLVARAGWETFWAASCGGQNGRRRWWS